jgi:hypothetical protein
MHVHFCKQPYPYPFKHSFLASFFLSLFLFLNFNTEQLKQELIWKIMASIHTVTFLFFYLTLVLLLSFLSHPPTYFSDLSFFLSLSLSIHLLIFLSLLFYYSNSPLSLLTLTHILSLSLSHPPSYFSDLSFFLFLSCSIMNPHFSLITKHKK